MLFRSVTASQELREETRTGWNALVSPKPHKVTDLEILPGLLNPLGLRLVMMSEVREVGRVQELSRLLRPVERSAVVLVGVVVAVLPVLRLRDLGRAEWCLGRPLLLLLLLLLLLPSLFDNSSSGRIKQGLRLTSAVERLRALLAEQRRSSDLALAPEALLALGAFLLCLLGLLEERALEEEGGYEGRETKGATFAATDIGIVEGAAKSEDLELERGQLSGLAGLPAKLTWMPLMERSLW